MNDHPYCDLSLTDRDGEAWRGVPGLEDYYQVSDQGRIKRLESQRKNKNGFLKHLPAKIIKPTVTKSFNVYTGDTLSYLTVTLWLDEQAHHFGVARLVYNGFVEPFAIKDRNLFIFYKDHDTLNMEPGNLILGDQKEKARRMAASCRRGQPFREITPERRAAIQQKINAVKAANPIHQISRYALSGKLIATYHNAEVAAKAIKSNAGTLSKAARGKLVTAKGYLWRRGDAPEIDISFLATRKGIGRSPVVKHLKRIGQYNTEGRLVKAYSTIREAANMMQVPFSNIADVVNGKHLSCKGYLWRRSVKNKIRVDNLKETPGYRYSPISVKARQLSQYDLDGRWQRSFTGISEAVKATGTDGKSIAMVVKGQTLTAGGHLWREGTALRINVIELKKHPSFPNSALERHLEHKRQAARGKRETALEY